MKYRLYIHVGVIYIIYINEAFVSVVRVDIFVLCIY